MFLITYYVHRFNYRYPLLLQLCLTEGTSSSLLSCFGQSRRPLDCRLNRNKLCCQFLSNQGRSLQNTIIHPENNVESVSKWPGKVQDVIQVENEKPNQFLINVKGALNFNNRNSEYIVEPDSFQESNDDAHEEEELFPGEIINGKPETQITPPTQKLFPGKIFDLDEINSESLSKNKAFSTHFVDPESGSSVTKFFPGQIMMSLVKNQLNFESKILEPEVYRITTEEPKTELSIPTIKKKHTTDFLKTMFDSESNFMDKYQEKKHTDFLKTIFDNYQESTMTTEAPIMEKQFPSRRRYSPTNGFKGGQRRGIVVSDSEGNRKDIFVSKLYKLICLFSEESGPPQEDEEGAEDLNELLPHEGYSRAICYELKVPCRFVSDHPCCAYSMHMDLVARARSMDGSADLVWRPNIQENKHDARARSLTSTSKSSEVQKYTLRRRKPVLYNFSTSKRGVSIPRYEYKGYGPEVTGNLLANCWRMMAYVKCSVLKSHPCCNINTKPSGPPTLGRVSRWLSA